MKSVRFLVCFLATAWLAIPVRTSAAERINQEGRILGPVPVLSSPVLFNTPEADAIVSAMQNFPVTNPWNEDISRLPLLANSDAMIAQIIADLSSTRRTLRAFKEMNFVLVPDNQAPQPIQFLLYSDESDPSPYPIPPSMPVETWPSETGTLTLSQWQQDATNLGGDRHAIIVQPGTGGLWETWQAQLSGTAWEASNGARFNLNSNSLRPAGWTSGDAAGLPMFPALVRYDECQRGMVEHACRIVVKRTRQQYLYPATHFASSTAATQVNVPAMGQRLRLKTSFVIPSNWSVEERALLSGLKKYGALVADNGNFFSISVTPDQRWASEAFSHLPSIGITNFEVVAATGPAGGPRSAGAPVAVAGGPNAAAPGVPVPLKGYVTYGGSKPQTRWTLYSGPGPVSFDDASQTNAVATFSAPGDYVLMLSADDGVHAKAFDALKVQVSFGVRLTILRQGTNVSLAWTGASGVCSIEASDNPEVSGWVTCASNTHSPASLTVGSSQKFFRLRSP